MIVFATSHFNLEPLHVNQIADLADSLTPCALLPQSIAYPSFTARKNYCLVLSYLLVTTSKFCLGKRSLSVDGTFCLERHAKKIREEYTDSGCAIAMPGNFFWDVEVWLSTSGTKNIKN